jgi:tetratricopeptide (TPR) repeat protein/tRNA A-37 threonylcarbamoyl transferase component Bud32
MPCLDENTIAQYVASSLSGDAREAVEEHLDSCPECLTMACEAARSSDFVNASTLADSSSPGRGRALQSIQPKRGDEVGRYTLLEMVGHGAMGAVYAAHDPKLDRKVALKVVRSDRLEMPEAHERLSREARAMAKLAHANVVRVYDTGEVEAGVFIAMELVDGVTMTQWLSERPRSWQEIVGVFLSAGRGLSAAHAAKIVHRDFKPDNVLIDRSGRVVVTDFGLAVASHGIDSSRDGRGASVDGFPLDVSLTRTGALVGTPRFMSPEQHDGRALDARTDQFSFAVSLYHALYGEWPFDGQSLAELRDAITSGHVRAGVAAKGAPPAVGKVLLRALRADPKERYPNMDALIADLQQASLPRSRRARLLGLLAAAVVVVGALAAVAVVRARQHTTSAPAAPASTVSPATARAGARDQVLILGIENRSGDPRLDGVVEAVLYEALYASTRLDSTYYGAARIARDLTPDAGAVDERLGRALAGRDHVTVFVLRGGLVVGDGGALILSIEVRDAVSGATAFHAHETGATASDVAAAAVRLSRDVRTALGESPSDVSANAVTLTGSIAAAHEWALGREAFAAGDSRRAIEHLRPALQADPQFALARSNLGLSLLNSGQDAPAATEMATALRDGDQLGPRRRLGVLGDYYAALGQYAKAIAAYEQLLSAWPGDRGAENSLTAAAGDGGDWPLALQLARRTVSEHPEVVSAHDNLLQIEIATGALGDAVQEGEDVFRSFPHPPPNAFVLTALGQALFGQADHARKTLDDLSAIDAKTADETRADFAFAEGRLDDAAALLQPLIEQARSGGDVARTAVLQGALAEVLLRKGDKRGAAAAALMAKDGVEGIRHEDSLARVLIATGQSKAALEVMSSWTSHPGTLWTLVAKVAQGDQRRAADDPRGAITAYLDALRVQDLWIVHERLAQAYLAAGAWQDAQREFSVCVARRGEGAVWDLPSLHLVPGVYYGLARAEEGLHSPEAPAAYQAFLALEPTAQHDPLADDARRRSAVPRDIFTVRP